MTNEVSPVPKGLTTPTKAVPVEPTQEMIAAGWDVLPFSPGTETHRMACGWNSPWGPDDIYKAMLAAAPTPAAQPVAWARPDELQKAIDSAYLCQLVGNKWPRARSNDAVPLYAAPVSPPAVTELHKLVEKWKDYAGSSANPFAISIYRDCYTALAAALAPQQKE